MSIGAPVTPLWPAHASASRRILALYSPVNDRRVGFVLTSVLGLPACDDITFLIDHARLALLGWYPNPQRGCLLTDVGTEGGGRSSWTLVKTPR